MTDEQLVQSFVARGDESAFAALVHRRGAMVREVCRRVLRHHHDADDAFQATLLVLARKAGAVASRDLLANWLYRVAYHAAIKARAVAARRAARERQVAQVPEPEAPGRRPWGDLRALPDQDLRGADARAPPGRPAGERNEERAWDKAAAPGGTAGRRGRLSARRQDSTAGRRQ